MALEKNQLKEYPYDWEKQMEAQTKEEAKG